MAMHDRMPSREEIAARISADGTPAGTAKRRWRWLALGGAGLVVLGLLLFGGGEAPRYVTAPVEKGALTVTVSATGTLEPLNQVDVGVEISGQIAQVNADFNDRVEKGHVLAVLDTQELQARVIEGEASAASARAQLAQARATALEARTRRDRSVALAKKGTVSSQERDIAVANADRAEAAVAQAESQIKVAEALLAVHQTNLARAEIRSPIDGIVLDRKIDPGQTVAAAFQTPVLFTIAEDLSRMRLHVDVDEADIGQVKAGQRATFTVDAYPDRQFSASVESVRFAPRKVEGVVTYEAVLDVANGDLALRPGMTATAEIVVLDVAETVTVPNGALRFTPQGFAAVADKDGTLAARRLKRGETAPMIALAPGEGVVWAAGGGSPKPYRVKTGASDGQRSVLLAGAVEAGTGLIVDVERKPEPAPRSQG